MAAPGALAVLLALSTLSPATMPMGQVTPRHDETALHFPQLTLHAPATVPSAASPQLQRDQAASGPDVDITGPVN